MSLVVDPKTLMTIFGKDSKETELVKLFSGEAALKSRDDSLLYLKKVVTISVSNLLFLRNVLPDISFQKFVCDKSMTLNLLCPIEANNDVIANKVISNLLDVFVGIEDKNVEKLIMSFLYRDTDDVAVTEMYTFHFEYKDEVSVTFSHETNNHKDDTQVAALYTKNANQLIGSTRAMIRQVQTLCNTIAPIPEGATPKVDIIVYHNSNVPEGYRLPGWEDLKVNLPSKDEGNQRESQLWLGHVVTPFHAMKLEHEALEGETNYFKHVYDNKKETEYSKDSEGSEDTGYMADIEDSKNTEEVREQAKVLFSYEAEDDDELTIKVGEIINIVSKEMEGWWIGELHGRIALFPDNFVEIIKPMAEEPNSSSLQQNAETTPLWMLELKQRLRNKSLRKSNE